MKYRLTSLRRLLICLAAPLAMLPVQAEETITYATLLEDTYLDNGSANTNYSGATTLLFRTFTSVWRNPLIQFSLPTLAGGDQVVKVELILQSATAAAGSGGTPDIEVLGTTTAIDLSTATYNSTNPTFQTGAQSGTSRLLWTEVWTDFSSEAVIPGADFSVNDVVTYTSTDTTQGMLKFVRDHIDSASNTTVTLGLGFISREGNDGTTSTGWSIYSADGSGDAPMLRITTAPIPEPGAIALLALTGIAALLLRRRFKR